MYSEGETFYGFSNGSNPDANSEFFNDNMNSYINFTGWTNGTFPAILSSIVPQSSGGFDTFGNPITAYNFETIEVSTTESTTGECWYTWVIPTGLTNNLTQLTIGYSTSVPSPLTIVSTEPTIHSNTFYYNGNVLPNTVYRVYTTYPGTNFRLTNNSSIYFKGESVG
jgi:hypothetical protein